MDLDGTDGEVKEQGSAIDQNVGDEMDVDAQKTASKPKHNNQKSKVEKKRAHRKARNSIIFPSITRKRKGPGMSKGKR